MSDKPNWYRVGLFLRTRVEFLETKQWYETTNADCEMEELALEIEPDFVRWLTPRIEYEV